MENPPLSLIGGAIILGYCLPSVIAFLRHHPSIQWICVLNICFGWTVLGWILALYWSITTRRKRHHRHLVRHLFSARRPAGRQTATNLTFGTAAQS